MSARLRLLPAFCLVTAALASCTHEDAGTSTEAVTADLVSLVPVARINFQPDSAPVPAGYTKEIGLAYGGSSGWVREDSLAGAHTPLALTPNTRDRNRAGVDQRLDTLIHMQFPVNNGNNTQVKIPAAFEYAVPAGTYRVTVSVGDQSPYDSSHVIHVEGTTAISAFVGSAASEFRQATVDVTVSDGRLTIDAIGGANTKLDYVDIDRVVTTPDPDGGAGGTTGAAGTGAAGTSAAGGTTGAAGTSAAGGTTGAAGTSAAGGTTGAAGTGTDAGTDAGSDAPAPRPFIRSISPVNGATAVNPTGFVAAELTLPNLGGIDETTMTPSTVWLARVSDGAVVPAVVNTSGGGDTIVLQPNPALAPFTAYRFNVTAGLLDVTGAAFVPFTSTFTTGATPPAAAQGFQFEKVALFSAASGRGFTSLAFGPDGKLYASTITGELLRYDVNADGTLANAVVINTIINAAGGARAVIGLAFDPASTAGSPILWVTHAYPTLDNAPEWTSKISKLSGATLGTIQDVVVGLPRSIRDHLTNSIAFRPGEPGVLYMTQGSISAMGAPDNAWGLRPERKLAGAVLRLDTALIGALPLDVRTSDGGGTYDPSAAGAPLTMFATGVRNAYDLVWHSNGQLYVPTNGSAAGGNTPATPASLPPECANRIDVATQGVYAGPSVPGLVSVGDENDYLYRVVSGGYYGHPNPARCEWVMNGGNPTVGADPSKRPEYPVGVMPDRNWRGAAFDFGAHYSPNGVLEYKNNVFGNALKGKLIVARYSGGDDLQVLTIDPVTKNVSASETGAPGMTGFGDPLDVVENTGNGHLYVAELGARRITLLRPSAAPQPLPAPWVGGDIGSVGPAGSANVVGSTYNVLASGTDIYNNADGFYFVRQQRSGDFTITARVTGLGNTNGAAKAGVMIRETLAAGLEHVFMGLAPTAGAKLTKRTTTNGGSTVTTIGGWLPPTWVRLWRQGLNVRAYVSSNGTTWTQVGTVAVQLPAALQVGLAVTSHDNTKLTTATFTDVSVVAGP